MADAVVNAEKAARWLNLSPESITRLCRSGLLKGAFQPAGYAGKWAIPVNALEAFRPCPEQLRAEITDLP
jgi:hypothetical protein